MNNFICLPLETVFRLLLPLIHLRSLVNISLNIKTKIAERYEIKRQNERKFCEFPFLKKKPDVCFLT